MPSIPVKGAVAAAALCLALAGCNGSVAPAPAAPTNISGDYSGTVQDSVNGSATATGTLAQHNASAGGGISEVFASTTLTAQFSVTTGSSNAVNGTIVIDYPGSGPTCTFSTTGSYSTATNVLSGSYTAVTNCSGESGTYSLTQQCTDTIVNGEPRRLKIGGIAPC